MSATRAASLATLALLILTPGRADAQYRHRGRGYNTGPAMTVYGPVYNPTMSSEYRLWASNPAAYERTMMQRQQQAMQKQQQAYVKEMQREQKLFQTWMKDQKARKDKGYPTDPAYDRIMRAQAASGPGLSPAPAAVRHRARTRTPAPSATAGGPRPPETKAATKDAKK